MPMSRSSSTDPLSPVKLSHVSGSTATIYPFGATVTSFETASKREILFVSSTAKLDGSKAIRGGIPLVFPQFGQPDKSYPQHGFLRCNVWTVTGECSEEGSDAACCEFTLKLKDVVAARGGAWSAASTEFDCVITLVVKLEAEKLTTVLTFKNTGEVAYDFQSLFHTYYKVEGGKALDKDVCHVTGLAGYNTLDQITGEEYIQDVNPIFVDREVDRIYKDSTKPTLDLVIATGGTGTGTKVSLQAKAKVDGVVTPVSVVVWNPFVEKAKGMGDFTDEQFHDMICVEPGILHEVPSLSKNAEAMFEQVITAL